MKINDHLLRLGIVCFFFVVILGTLLWRMIDLTVLHRQFLQGQGAARSVRIYDIPAYRGMITDRLGAALAISTPVQSVWINPKAFAPNSQQLTNLAQLLGISSKNLRAKLRKADAREFLYLRRQLPPAIVQKIAALKIPGINFQQEFKRYYPEADSTAQLLGFTNIDDHGIEGLELAYEQWLGGENGKKRVLKDRLGQIIEELDVIKEPRSGRNLTLSIDRRIQYLAYHELQNTLEKFAAKSGSVVVLDTQNGEILAIANSPSYNPNVRERFASDYYRNKAVTDVFEPGSVIKPFSIASALNNSTVKPDTLIDTSPSWMNVHGHTIRDVHNYGLLNVAGILQHSSNVGVTKMVLLNPAEQLIGVLRGSGFGQRTESNYPGESEGSVVSAKDANPFVLATLGFGYGLSVTALQLAKAYLIFANEGKLLPISLIHNEEVVQAKQVIAKKTAKQVLAMMETVLDNEGTGKLARVPGYRVAGKTGTARIAGKRGYEANRHTASFAGIAPVTAPRLVVVVVVHEPSRNSYYGAAVAAPLFAQIMSGALRILEVPPDKATT